MNIWALEPWPRPQLCKPEVHRPIAMYATE